MDELYTIGHSNHSIERFIELVSMHSITAVCDVRSQPYSKFNPQFNREPIKETLKGHGIAYIFLGKELGPRSDDPACFVNGGVSYHKLAGTKAFCQGLNRLRDGMKSYRIALMCAEKDPIACHRTILICRQLRSDKIKIRHILEDGSLEDNSDSERRLMRILKIPETDFFDSREDLISRAYDIQGERISPAGERGKDHEQD